MKIGILTIGQSPRVDIIPELKKAIGFEVEIEEKGALDELTWEEVKDLYPGPDDYILVTRMRDGREIKIAERHIIQRISKCIADLEKKEVDFIILLCTGEFPDIISKKPILKPNKLLENVIRGILQEGVMAVIVPSLDQIPLMEKKWKKTNLKIIVEAISPYTGTREEIEKIAKKIEEKDVDLIVLDCLGFNRGVKTIFRKITKTPVLLPRTLFARVVGELIER